MARAMKSRSSAVKLVSDTNLLLADFADRVPEIVDVGEAAVDGGEADVGDLVELAQLLHHHLAQPAGVDLALAQREHLLLDALDGGVDELGGHGPLVQRPLEAGAQLLRRELLAHALRLHDLRHAQLGGLVGREALVANLAAAPPADRVALLAHARVDHLGVLGVAEGALHAAALPSARPSAWGE